MSRLYTGRTRAQRDCLDYNEFAGNEDGERASERAIDSLLPGCCRLRCSIARVEFENENAKHDRETLRKLPFRSP